MESLDLTELILAQEKLEAETDTEHFLKNSDELELTVLQHIQRFASNSKITLTGFPKGCTWINTSRPLELNDLRGKIVILDMFTYCCINCMHILPDLEALELEYPVESGVVVIGVHSAKFDNEKQDENVINAVLRYEIHHPVINDHKGELWNLLSVNCWPTLFILGPERQILFTITGEGNKAKLFYYTRKCVEYFDAKGEIIHEQLPIKHHKLLLNDSHLKFPGKISCCPNDKLLAVADTGNHRILILSTNGLMRHCIGGNEPGFTDGNFAAAKFHSPQGITWKDNCILFVADTENHAIRKIDIRLLSVETITGNGTQGNDKIGGKKGKNQTLNSPWDVRIGSWNYNLLFIAMSGSHQIWALALEDTSLPNGTTMPKDTCFCIAGSGYEENRNNRYSLKASFAQPSGICFANINEESYLIVADSESSTIRSIDLKTFSVTGLVGGGLDPKNLFEFGDKDGIKTEVKLQHPLGVTWDSKRSKVYIADSYNHKIKELDIKQRRCKTCSELHIENSSVNGLKEPGGLDILYDHTALYIADTNNHRIVVVNLDETESSPTELLIKFPSDTVVFASTETSDATDNVRKFTLTPKPHIKHNLEPIQISSNGLITFEVVLLLESNLKLNSEAPNAWHFVLTDNSNIVSGFESSGVINDINSPLKCQIETPSTALSEGYSAVMEVKVYYCDNKGCCHLSIAQLEAKLVEENSKTNATRNFQLGISLN